MMVCRIMLTDILCLCKNDEFDRDPTPTEIEFGKYQGVPALIEYCQG
jgi:hypothetical protein